MNWWPCCCGGDTCCPCTSTRPDNISVTLAGYGNGDCTCSSLNAAHVLDYDLCNGTPGTLGNYCQWSKTLTNVPCSAGDNPRTIVIEARVVYGFIGGANRVYWQVTVTDTSLDVIAQYYGSVTTTAYRIDCEAEFTGMAYVSGAQEDTCGDASGTTCEIN